MSMKKWQKQRDRAREVLSREVGFVQKPHGGRLRVALAFPNTYFVGMSSLGFQTTYRLFNGIDDVVCERVFLPPKQELQAQLASGAPLLTLESQTPVRDFDVLAFSVSFEWDYTNVVTMLRLAGLEPRAAARRPRDPLVVIGGAVTFVNPEPLALFADVIAAGEGESLIPDLVETMRETRDREEILTGLAARRGFYVPEFYDVALRAGRIHCRLRAASRHRGAGHRPQGRREDDRRARSSGHVDLHAGYRIRIAIPHRGRSRLRQPVPLLLGRLQLSAGAAVPDGSHPPAGRRRATLFCARRSRVDRALRSSRDRSHPAQPDRHGLLDQPGVAAARRSHAVDRADAPRERRALDHDRARGRLGSAAACDQQDRDQPGNPRRGGADLRQRHGEPEALLHDRPAHRNRRRPGRDSRSDRGHARGDDAARPRERAASAGSSAASTR